MENGRDESFGVAEATRSTTFALLFALAGVVAPGSVHAQGYDVPAADPDYRGPQEISAQLWFDRGHEPVVERGDRMRVYYRTSADAYVAIFNIDTNGTVRLVHPRSPDDPHRVRGGRDYRLLFPRSPYWYVDDTPGLGYYFIVASPEPFDLRPFDYSPYDRSWNLRSVGRHVYSDPYVAMDEYVATLLPDWEYVPFALDVASYHVGRERYQYPRFLCYDCHGFRSYQSWNPYHRHCTSFRVVIYDDPFYYPFYRYRGHRVVFTGIRRRHIPRAKLAFADIPFARLPRFDFKERARDEPPPPLVATRATHGPRDRAGLPDEILRPRRDRSRDAGPAERGRDRVGDRERPDGARDGRGAVAPGRRGGDVRPDRRPTPRRDPTVRPSPPPDRRPTAVRPPSERRPGTAGRPAPTRRPSTPTRVRPSGGGDAASPERPRFVPVIPRGDDRPDRPSNPRPERGEADRADPGRAGTATNPTGSDGVDRGRPVAPDRVRPTRGIPVTRPLPPGRRGAAGAEADRRANGSAGTVARGSASDERRRVSPTSRLRERVDRGGAGRTSPGALGRSTPRPGTRTPAARTPSRVTPRSGVVPRSRVSPQSRVTPRDRTGILPRGSTRVPPRVRPRLQPRSGSSGGAVRAPRRILPRTGSSGRRAPARVRVRPRSGGSAVRPSAPARVRPRASTRGSTTRPSRVPKRAPKRVRPKGKGGN